MFREILERLVFFFSVVQKVERRENEQKKKSMPQQITNREKERYPDLQKAVITLPSMEPEIGAAKLAARLI